MPEKRGNEEIAGPQQPLTSSLLQIEASIIARRCAGQAALQQILGAIATAGKVTGAMIAVPRRGKLVSCASAGDAPQEGTVVSDTSELYQNCIDQARTISCRDVVLDKRIQAGSVHFRSAVLVPLRARISPIGVLAAYSSVPQGIGGEQILGLGVAATLSASVLSAMQAAAQPAAEDNPEDNGKAQLRVRTSEGVQGDPAQPPCAIEQTTEVVPPFLERPYAAAISPAAVTDLDSPSYRLIASEIRRGSQETQLLVPTSEGVPRQSEQPRALERITECVPARREAHCPASIPSTGATGLDSPPHVLLPPGNRSSGGSRVASLRLSHGLLLCILVLLLCAALFATMNFLRNTKASPAFRTAAPFRQVDSVAKVAEIGTPVLIKSREVTASDNIFGGRLVHSPAPVFAPTTLDSEHEVTLRAILLVNGHGTVSHVQVTDGPAVLAEPTVAALSQWRFAPFFVEGNASGVSVQVPVTIQFQPAGDRPPHL